MLRVRKCEFWLERGELLDQRTSRHFVQVSQRNAESVSEIFHQHGYTLFDSPRRIARRLTLPHLTWLSLRGRRNAQSNGSEITRPSHHRVRWSSCVMSVCRLCSGTLYPPRPDTSAEQHGHEAQAQCGMGDAVHREKRGTAHLQEPGILSRSPTLQIGASPLPTPSLVVSSAAPCRLASSPGMAPAGHPAGL